MSKKRLKDSLLDKTTENLTKAIKAIIDENSGIYTKFKKKSKFVYVLTITKQNTSIIDPDTSAFEIVINSFVNKHKITIDKNIRIPLEITIEDESHACAMARMRKSIGCHWFILNFKEIKSIAKENKLKINRKETCRLKVNITLKAPIETFVGFSFFGIIKKGVRKKVTESGYEKVLNQAVLAKAEELEPFFKSLLELCLDKA